MGTKIIDDEVVMALAALGYRADTLPGNNGAMDILNNKDHCKELLERLGKEGGIATVEWVLREALNWPTENEKDTPMAKATGVVEHLKKICKKSKTLDEIVAALAEKFPDRDPDKMRSTVRTQLGGRLAAAGHTVTKETDEKRGKVYTITVAAA